MKMKIARVGSILLTVAFAACLGLAPQDAAAQAVKTKSTGVGHAERTVAAGYSVRFEFAELTGAYMGNVAVQVKDASGNTVVNTVSVGPWLLADLAPGAYRIAATAANGKKQGAAFVVEGGKTQIVRLAWR
jgi:hypothetical protein